MSLLSNFLFLGVNTSSLKIKIGEVIPVMTNAFDNPSPNTVLSGGFVRTDSIQPKALYPALAEHLGTTTLFQKPIVTNLTSVNSGTTTDILASVYGNGRYVASLANGNLITSTDRINWTNVSLSSLNLTDPITTLTYGNGQYVGGGNRGTLISSTNGTTWITRNLNSSNNVGFVAFANNLFFVGGNSYPGFIRTSTDLVTWTNNLFNTSGYNTTTFTFKTMTYGNNTYMVGAQNGWIFSSSNTTTWNYVTSVSGGCYSLTYGETSNGVNTNTVFLAVSSQYDRYIQPQSQGSYPSYIYTNINNQGFTQRKRSDYNAGYYSTVYANNQFIVSGGASYPYEVSYASTDGINFYPRENLSDPAIIINSMATDGQNIVEFGDFGHISTYRLFKSASIPFYFDSNTHFYVPPYDPDRILLQSSSGISANNRTFANNYIQKIKLTQYMKATNDDTTSFPEGGLFQPVIVNEGYNDADELLTGKVVRSDRIYLQADYPKLFNQVGHLGASHFQKIETMNTVLSSANSNTRISISNLVYGNNTYVFAANSSNQITTLIFSSNNLQDWSNTSVLHPGEFSFSSSPKYLTYGNGKFALAGMSGVYATSTDGRDWFPKRHRAFNTSTPFYSMTYGNGIYVVAGSSTPPNVFTSTNLISWTTRSVLSTTWYAAFYNNGTYMLGCPNAVHTSSDAVTWTARTCAVGTIYKISYANNLYLAGGDSGFATSTDAITWTTVSLGTGQTSAYSHATGNGIYMIGDTSGRLKTSTDLVTWDTRSIASFGVIYRIAYGNGIFVLTDGSAGSIKTSTDNGATWVQRDSKNARGLIFSLDYSNGVFYYSDQSGYLSTSTDAINWNTTYNSRNTFAYYNSFLSTELNSIFYVGSGQGHINQYRLDQLDTGNIYHPLPSYPYATAVSNFKYSNGSFYISGSAPGTPSSPFFGTSTDLVKWEMTPSANVANTIFNNNWYTGTYGGGQFVIAGDSGQLRTSTHPEAQIWETRSTLGSETIVRVKHINGLYITGGSSGVVRTSTDAITWTQRTSGTTQTIRDFAYGQSRYFFVAEGGAIQSTTNFVTWETRTSGSTSGIYSIVYNNGLFVSSSYNKVITSNDGVTWTTRTMNLDGSGVVWYYKVMYGNGIYVAAGDSGYIKTSTDAVTWNIRPSGISGTIYGGEYSNGRFYLLNQYTSDRYRYDLVTSTDGINWSQRYVGIAGQYRYYYDIFRGNGRHIVLGQNGYAASFKEDFFLPTSNSIFDMGNEGGRTYFVGANSTIASSTNGNLFERRASKANTFFIDNGQTNFNAITYGAGKYIAVGSKGIIRTSTDSIFWQVSKSNTPNTIISVAYGNGTFVYTTSSNGEMRSSNDAVNWKYTTHAQNLDTNILSTTVVFANNLFLTSGSNAHISFSTDPQNYIYSTIYNPQTEFIVPYINVFNNLVTSPTVRSTFQLNYYIGVGDN